MFNRTLRSFVPLVYDGVVELESLIDAEEREMDTARREMSAAFANTFVLTADESGILMFENMLGILANPNTENLEFRRQRLLNRLSMNPPYTYRFLKKKLDEVIGVGAWTSYIDFDNYTLYVESSASNQNWYSEIEFTINRIKPCNIVFTNVPYTAAVLNLSEEISYETNQWRYRLGAWRLGQYPFVTIEGGGVIKMPEIKSVQPALIEDAANFVLEEVSYILINDTLRVTSFVAETVGANAASIVYTVTPDMTELITDLKLMSADDRVLTQASVYVPVRQTIRSKHTITVKEGV